MILIVPSKWRCGEICSCPEPLTGRQERANSTNVQAPSLVICPEPFRTANVYNVFDSVWAARFVITR
jgi:hypothetical protein